MQISGPLEGPRVAIKPSPRSNPETETDFARIISPAKEQQMKRAFVAIPFLISARCFCALHAQAQQSFTLEQVMSAPFRRI